MMQVMSTKNYPDHFYGYVFDEYGDLRSVLGGDLQPVPIEEELSLSFNDNEDIKMLTYRGSKDAVMRKVEKFNAKVNVGGESFLSPLKVVHIKVSLLKENPGILEDVNRCISNSGYIETFIKKYGLGNEQE